MLAPPGHVHDQRIDHHVARASVEGDDFAALGRRWNHSDVGDAADVQRHAPRAPVAKQQVIDQRHQRGALSTRRDIALPEVRDDPKAGTLRDHGRFADLQRAGDAVPQVLDRFAFMKDGLPVHAEQGDRIERDALAAAGFVNRRGI